MDRQDDLDQHNPLRNLGLAYRTFTRIVDPQLREYGFAMSQLPVLRALKGGKQLSQIDLARMAKVEQPSMAQLLNRMERDGLIERLPNPDDKRSSLIALTQAAAKRMSKAKAVMDATVGLALVGLSKAERDQLERLMARINGNLETVAAKMEHD